MGASILSDLLFVQGIYFYVMKVTYLKVNFIFHHKESQMHLLKFFVIYSRSIHKYVHV
jgi:hypothetical protein